MSDHTNLIYYAVYNRDKIEKQWPCLVSSSGGGGHNAAIEALRSYILEQYAAGKMKLLKPDLQVYMPVNHAQKPRLSMQKKQIELGLGLPQTVKEALNYLGLPILPNTNDINNEIDRLANQNIRERYYIDVLLDIYPTGYENVAIWNVLQKQDKTQELKKLIDLQKQSDYFNYQHVYSYFVALFEAAAAAGTAYTNVISSQAMALPALCDAVLYYNVKVANKYQALPIIIHQYLTDLPSIGAVHFLKSLERLTPIQRSCILLYGINLTRIREFNLLGFAGFVDIDPNRNPMVRRGFYNEQLQEIARLETDIALAIQVKGKEDVSYIINKDECIASIMLGSQASLDTIHYVKQIEASGNYQKIFVFGGTLPHIFNELAESTGYKQGKIILLDNQDDKHIASIIVRSKLVVIRGGGLCIMEQMALPHPKNQLILVHTKENGFGKLSSGISWEDCNVDGLESKLNSALVSVRRTTVTLIARQLAQLQVKDAKDLESDFSVSSKLYLKAKLLDLQNKLKKYYNYKHYDSSVTTTTKKNLAINLISNLEMHMNDCENPSCQVDEIAIRLAALFTYFQLKNKQAYDCTLFLKMINDKGTLGVILDEALETVKEYCPLDYLDKCNISDETFQMSNAIY